MTIIDVFKKLGVAYSTDDVKHCHKGWVQTLCPWCKGINHLGWSLTGFAVNCWQCGRHQRLDALLRLTRIGQGEAKRLLAGVRGRSGQRFKFEAKARLVGPKRNKVVFPKGVGPLARPHKFYLKNKRDFNTVSLIRDWGILGVGPLGGRWRHRILIPVTFGGDIVTWQARAIGKIEPKYLACPPKWETRPIKSCVYGLDQAVAARLKTIVVVEGVTDVWRLGIGTVCTFGTGYSSEQIKLIIQNGIERAIVLRDPGRMEWKQAFKLATELTQLGLDSEAVSLIPGSDPGGLSYTEARELMETLLNHVVKR